MTVAPEAPSVRAELVSVARDVLDHTHNGTVRVTDSVMTLPAWHYTDPAHFEVEKRRLFRRIPIVVAASCEMPNPGDQRAIDIAGVPVLVVRGRDGVARAFLNVCTHRAAVIGQGCTNAARITCPYHGWVFDDRGALVGITGRSDFGTIDTEQYSLRALPVRERAGLIWAVLDPASTLDIDGFLGVFGSMLERFGLEHWHPVAQRSLTGANWKLAFDAHLEFYQWPDTEWTDEAMMLGEWIIYPNISINTFYRGGRGVLISQIFPGDAVDSSVTVQTYFMENEPTDEQRAEAISMFDFLGDVIGTEDLPTSMAQQRALSSGLMPTVCFGRNEGGPQEFHRWTERIIAADDTDLNALFAGDSHR